MIACVAVVGKQNQPLYIRTFVETKDDFGFRFHFHVHTSLDVINEKGLYLYIRHIFFSSQTSICVYVSPLTVIF